MHDTLPLLTPSSFPPLTRKRLETLQVNIGLRCNLACLHCHVNSSPYRKEMMDAACLDLVLKFLQTNRIPTLDITGGAPELHPGFRDLITGARKLHVHVMDRCNLTILEEPGFEDLHEFLAGNKVEIVASLPCYLEENVDRQRGRGVYQASIRALQKLNRIGYGLEDGGLVLNLVYNPLGPTLPPAQVGLEQDYKEYLSKHHGIVFNRLYTLANMPIKRFGSTLISKGQFHPYLSLLRNAHQDQNLEHVMCRTLISVDWQGYIYDCDFNQMLGLGMRLNGNHSVHLSDLLDRELAGEQITVRNHCYGCTAGQGSSCGGALNQPQVRSHKIGRGA
ncbi:MAG: radical SAM protein [Gammaproteobacteria bacterium RIFCSPLOWO2_12_FULL_52_10]|nr:MAG: radical SAM protein [Gammaproteobacteria bacterium RIFCSPLOWO2_12_FULL_52_10]